jgi:outer membrane receptor protein involved in Fe transport
LSVTGDQLEQGGYGIDVFWDKNKESVNLTGEWFLDAGKGSHEIKFGFSDITNEHYLDEYYTGGARYNSINANDIGATLDDYLALDWKGEVGLFNSDVDRMISAMEASADPSVYLNLFDADNSGDISADELRAGLVFDSTTGNPNGEVNASRTLQAVQGAQNFEQRGTALFIQDSWSIDEHWTLDIGFRAERWEHIASDAKTKVFTFDYEIAPRVSLVYDINGDGASKVWGFFGRYYDPIRTNMTEFAGKKTGTVRHEQVYISALDEWLTYRVRGLGDGYFAPTTKTPYTDEILLGYERALTENQSISVIYTNRKTRDIFEDYDLGLYTENCGTFCLDL